MDKNNQNTTLRNRLSRREFLKVLITAAIAGSIGYLGGKTNKPETITETITSTRTTTETVTKTVEKPVTRTITKTVTETQTQTVTQTIEKPIPLYCSGLGLILSGYTKELVILENGQLKKMTGYYTWDNINKLSILYLPRTSDLDKIVNLYNKSKQIAKEVLGKDYSTSKNICYDTNGKVCPVIVLDDVKILPFSNQNEPVVSGDLKSAYIFIKDNAELVVVPLNQNKPFPATRYMKNISKEELPYFGKALETILGTKICNSYK